MTKAPDLPPFPVVTPSGTPNECQQQTGQRQCQTLVQLDRGLDGGLRASRQRGTVSIATYCFPGRCSVRAAAVSTCSARGEPEL